MTHIHAIIALAALDWAAVNREYDGIAPLQRHCFNPALHARPLFGQDELAAGKVDAKLGQ